ncbi:MAG: bifunctional protein HldE [Phycisphaerae bacterium]|nr:MAG: adenylyltransferase/cytidyltransferase family protein [Planctomycetia bacterium]RIK70653.1 MAG: hypothetical protein DCC66_05075 [Planctomycetota bacterium]GJQ26337.1 MAG: bifunctional protein HldE [Phycisphaerae bacterium]
MIPRETGVECSYREKILSPAALAAALARLRDNPLSARSGDGSARAPVVVQCHGCFDIVHPGHIRYLQFARSLGDVLVVSITGDAQISKGDQRPYIPEELRAENLAALAFVDYVVIDQNETAVEILRQVRPDIYVKGQEYAASQDPRFLAERQTVESHGGRVVFSSGQVVFSSTRLAESLARVGEFAADRLGVVCRRHGIDRSTLAELLGRMRGRSLLVIGETTLERYVACDVSAAAGEAPMMSLLELGEREYVGEAGAVALAAAALGAPTTLVTALGRDASSRRLRQALESGGVRVEALSYREDAVVRTRFVADDQKLFRVDRAGARPLDSISERAVTSLVRELAARVDAFIVHDCGYGFVMPGMVEAAAASLHEAGRWCTVSAGGQGTIHVASSPDLICVSERRLREAAGSSSGGLSAVAYEVMQATGAARMLVSVAKRGVVTFDRRSHDRASPNWHDRLLSEYLPALSEWSLDRLGCGESATAAATLAMAAGATLMQASYLYSAVAAVQIGRLGIVPVTAEELARWLAGRTELASVDSGERVGTRLLESGRGVRSAPVRKAPHAAGV